MQCTQHLVTIWPSFHDAGMRLMPRPRFMKYRELGNGARLAS